MPTTPQGFADALIAAWKVNSQPAAQQVAEQSAIDTLFATPYTDPVTLSECSGAAGSIICKYTTTSLIIQVNVRNTTGGLPMLVTSVRVTGAGG